VVLHDIQFVGGMKPAAKGPLSIELRLRGWDMAEDRVRSLQVGEGSSVHFRPVDDVVDFGRAPAQPATACLVGAVSAGATVVACFRAPVVPDLAPGGVECFLFAVDGSILGRIAVETRIGPAASLRNERGRAGTWARRDAFAVAKRLGAQLGMQLSHAVARKAR
jgi:hypothetical protein